MVGDHLLKQQLRQRAEQLIYELICPHCGSQFVQFIGLIVPPGKEKEAERTVAGGGTGGGLGAGIGYLIANVPGAAVGAAIGGYIGSVLGAESVYTGKAEYRCQGCGHEFTRTIKANLDD